MCRTWNTHSISNVNRFHWHCVRGLEIVRFLKIEDETMDLFIIIIIIIINPNNGKVETFILTISDFSTVDMNCGSFAKYG